MSEAELVRRALGAVLAAEPGGGATAAPLGSPLDELLAHTRRIGEGRRLDGGWDREALYDDRGYRPGDGRPGRGRAGA